MIEISLSSSYDQYWRYNAIIMCGGYDASAQQLYVVGNEDVVSQICTNLTAPPHDYPLSARVTRLEAEECDNIHLIVYVIPHSLPQLKDIPVKDNPPFDVDVQVRCGGRELHAQSHKANVWGGMILQLKLKCK